MRDNLLDAKACVGGAIGQLPVLNSRIESWLKTGFLGTVYCCPNCDAAVGAQIDPAALNADLVTKMKKVMNEG